MLWLAAYLPALPLEVFSRALSAQKPIAVSLQSDGSRILLCNRAAAAGGVRPGHGVGAAQARVAGLRVLVRDEAAEQAALQRLGAWAGQYSSQISLEPPQALILEVARSVKLFGSVGTIVERMRAGLKRLGYYAVRIAVAPTPLGALLLARAGRQEAIADGHALQRALGSLPLQHLPLDGQVLQAMGLRVLADLLRLPRQGLNRRLGVAFVDYLDRLLGRIPDPRPLFQPPPHFSAHVTLPSEVESTEALMFACRRLILEMCGYLSARGCGTQRLGWVLEHSGKADTAFFLGLLQPSRASDHFQELLRERLERVELAAPVLGIRLTAGDIQPLGMESEDFFESASTTQRSGPNELLERLFARLSDEVVHGLQPLPEHRPERAWTYCPPGQTAPSLPFGKRPLWLLPEPEPLEIRSGWPWWGGPLELEPERERIESGWWDGGDVARDYFVAHNPEGERLWVYRELMGEQRWFLHGLFG